MGQNIHKCVIKNMSLFFPPCFSSKNPVLMVVTMSVVLRITVSHISLPAEDRIFNSGKCELVMTPPHSTGSGADGGWGSLPYSLPSGVSSGYKLSLILWVKSGVLFICSSLIMSKFDQLICLMAFYITSVHFYSFFLMFTFISFW